ncbi:ribose-phosphate diphosphokinase [Clostridium grantii]|uniref:Putative ribose-phosphate pyrophosphokinase n=1 Tax=Clostridium grantii DSM 8605 TaxID=1121316 RepID=A0A1M5VSQ7_9CLOT|nr:ribose-phosphate pyrophosphokinase [Clostridium grantii]SHH78218.1 ribose-phosphate pyrophosphokinase [Clostridium grantii DSM 8605]
MYYHGKELKIFSGNSNKPLADEVAEILGTKVGDTKVTKFSDGEISVNTEETVRGYDTFVIQATNNPVNDNLMELLIMIDAYKRASVGRVTAVIPYYGYARQDRKLKSRDPISAKLVANLITKSGADRVLTVDLHASQVQGYFNIPVDNLRGEPIIGKYFVDKGFKDRDDVVLVAPDAASVPRVRKLATRLDAPIAIIDRKKDKLTGEEIVTIIGEVKGKCALLMDDIIDTGTRMARGSEILIVKGAKEVYGACSHPVLSGDAVEKIKNSEIKEVVMLNTINLPEEKRLEKFTILSIAPLMAEAVRRIYENDPVSKLFE